MMKTKFFALVFAVIAFGACEKEIRLDIKQIHETDKTASWVTDITRPVFSSPETEIEKSCVRFNDEITGLVNGIHAAFLEQCKEVISALDSIGDKQAAPYELIIGDTVFLADDRYISVRISSYEMIGGANGIMNYYGVNYDVKEQRFLNKKDLLKADKSAEINALLKENLRDPDKCFTFDAPTVDNVTAINFTRESVEFTYNKYILGPGSCGPATISVPRNRMDGMLMLK